MQFINQSTSDLDSISKDILDYSKVKFFVLEGDLGAGKTTLVQHFCKALGYEGQVQSPTYSIVNQYDINGIEVNHFDFYRLHSIEEAYDVGVEELFFSDGYCFVEWAERVAELLPKTYCKITISMTESGGRTYEVSL
ncbi:MAG: tRNA (adenosine(37)-N6)-threonylcarbamoyltransferase complex ATPase subunit type 1 TsaE [Flavobacteriales bacterium]